MVVHQGPDLHLGSMPGAVLLDGGHPGGEVLLAFLEKVAWFNE